MPTTLPIGLVRTLMAAVLLVAALLQTNLGTVSAQESTQADAAEDHSEFAVLASGSLLLDAVETGGRFVVVGDRGHVLLNDDPASGAWTQVAVPTRVMLTAVTGTDDGRLWAVGHDAVILHSSDRGESWQLQNRDPNLEAPLLDVWFEDDRHGFAVGAYGLAYETFDAGSTWERVTIDEEEPHFYSLFEAADGSLILTGEFGTILRSTDRGASWIRLESPYEGSFFGGIGLSDGTLQLFGLRGNLFRSGDYGESWQKIDTGITASLLSASESEGGRVAIAGLSGTLLQSDDGGKTFSLTSGLRREGLSKVLALPGGGLLLTGESGVFLLANATTGAAQ